MKKILSVSLLLTATAWADPVDVSLVPRALIGKGIPQLNLQINEPIAGFEVKLKRSDGKVVDVKGGGRPGQTRTIDLTQPEGTFHYQGELAVNLPKGETSTMPLEFDASLFGPLRLTSEHQEDNVAHRRLTFSVNRPAAKAHLKVLMDTGKTCIDDDIPFSGEPAGKTLEVSWPEAPGKVMTIHLEAYDTESFHVGVDFSPWVIDIPHQEVNFDTAKWDIRPGEQPKLDDSYQKIDDAVTKYGQWALVKLYIAGHTDTVGGTQYNRGLSQSRARSIGAYFRKKGVRVPIFYEGFGEEALKVQTPDETDEPRNRRAEYFLALEPPQVKGATFAPHWRPL